MLPYMDEASAESSKKGWTNFSSSEDSRGSAEHNTLRSTNPDLPSYVSEFQVSNPIL